ncbi:Cytochrome P450 monooxygenase [Psilocybe cubensis]|uniref:Cytochrome P450 monooxygenase n=1 Tax=Psilocybe cubensis TaxID=181762 RepID=A0ACB8GN04_PSICU|nr:Cytochrome P450 monooxygenase [Psilocybe cubensis]KAH9476434.1 Cytochrome P450 monooxygenase [Psilocybe cubensis]
MQIVKELLDNRASETSSRPSIHALDAICGGNFFALASSHTDLWKTGKKLIGPFMTPNAIKPRIPVVERESLQLLQDLVRSPENLCAHIFRFSLSSVTTIVYGERVTTHDSVYSTEFSGYLEHFLKAISPESAPVDLIPLLRYIPARFAPWKGVWKETGLRQRRIYSSFFEDAEREIKSGRRSGNFIETILNRQEELGLSRDLAVYLGGSMLDAGTESTSAIVQSLILCLAQYPDVMKKAQDEIDSYVGDGRLPVPGDIDGLPYVQAVVKEVHRFRTAAPTGLPHAPTHDLEYRGCIIPKGATIMVNVWAILHDPGQYCGSLSIFFTRNSIKILDHSELFECPDTFWPERYLLNPNGTRPGLEKDYTVRTSLHFGSGKRLCPGMHFSNTLMGIVAMRLLWAFNFSPENGSAKPHNTLDIIDGYTEGIAFAPKDLKCKIVPRSQEKIDIITEYYDNQNRKI